MEHGGLEASPAALLSETRSRMPRIIKVLLAPKKTHRRGSKTCSKMLQIATFGAHICCARQCMLGRVKRLGRMRTISINTVARRSMAQKPSRMLQAGANAGTFAVVWASHVPPAHFGAAMLQVGGSETVTSGDEKLPRSDAEHNLPPQSCLGDGLGGQPVELASARSGTGHDGCP